MDRALAQALRPPFTSADAALAAEAHRSLQQAYAEARRGEATSRYRESSESGGTYPVVDAAA
jgi:hypothetical protein